MTACVVATSKYDLMLHLVAKEGPSQRSAHALCAAYVLRVVPSRLFNAKDDCAKCVQRQEEMS
jgi:hypothetical protein